MERKVVRTSKAPQPVGPYSQAIRAGNFVFVAGQGGLDPATGELAPDLPSQTTQTLQNLKAILTAAGATLADVVKTTVFLDDMDDFAEMNKIYASFFQGDPPARSTIEAAALPMGSLVEIEAIAFVE